ncbi:MAG: AEC family transporter [Caldilineales bacterium]
MPVALQILWQVLAPIFLTAGTGFLLSRRAGLRPEGLAKAAFYIFSPCLLFDKLSHTHLAAADLGRITLFAALTIGGAAVLGWLATRWLRLDQATGAALILCVMAGNTGNYGLPANQFAYGAAALDPAVVYYAMSTLILSTVGIYVIARGRKSAAQALRNVLTVPLTYAGLAGLLVWAGNLAVPLPLERFAGIGSQAAIPVMLVILGAQLAEVRIRQDFGPIVVASAVKLLSGPLLGLLFAAALGLSGITRKAVIVEASMPTAVMAIVLATQYDNAPRFTAGVVLVSTLASLFTVTLLLAWLQ